jgi:ATP-dependent helicase HrpA
VSKWNARPADDALRDAFAAALQRSVAARQARAASLPAATVDPALPIATEAERIVELIRRHPVVVIAARPARARPRSLPKLCLAAGRGARGHDRLHPAARIAARAVARRVAEELQSPLGGAVGYQVRFTETRRRDRPRSSS